MTNNIINWMRVMRLPFLTASIIPVLVGVSYAWYETGIFYPVLFVLSLIGSIAVHIGTNLLNEFVDYTTGNDAGNKYHILPFSGGSGVLQEGSLRPSQVYRAAMICYAVAFFLGVILAYTRGILVLYLTVAGILSGYSYDSPPLKLVYRGVGELMVGISFGFFIITGSYYMQTQKVTPEILLIALPIAILISAVLYINEFPDYEADKAVGKNHLVVRLGTKKAAVFYSILMTFAYISLLIILVLRILPPIGVVTLLTAPIAFTAMALTGKYHDRPLELCPANASTILIHFTTGGLISAVFVATRMMG